MHRLRTSNNDNMKKQAPLSGPKKGWDLTSGAGEKEKMGGVQFLSGNNYYKLATLCLLLPVSSRPPASALTPRAPRGIPVFTAPSARPGGLPHDSGLEFAAPRLIAIGPELTER